MAASPNKTKLIVGLFLVIVAFGCLVYLFYDLTQSNRQAQEKNASLQIQLTDLIAQKSATAMDTESHKRATGTPIKVEDLARKADEVYGEEEKKQREGFLWVDRGANSYMITLGTINGLAPGSHLNVYDGNLKIDEVEVVNALDIVSYVKPKKPSQYSADYYRVVIE